MKKNDNFDKKPKYWESMTKKSRGIFSIASVIPHIIIIAIVYGIYYYLMTNGLFPEWSNYIYWGMKIIIGFEVLAASARSLWGPILGVLGGISLLL